MPADEPLFTRAELLGGLPARRASTVLFAIEARAAHLVARSRRAMAIHETERSSANRERAFLDALAGARDLPLHPSIQDLERWAPRWADVAPREPDLRAAIAKLLSRKYKMPRERTPRLRAALRLDDPETQATYRRLHGTDIDEIYTDELGPPERLRWLRSNVARRFEELPPFWTAYALALTEAVGAGVLALPIALAGLGPLPGIVFLVVAGIFNLMTIGGLVEAITRSGRMRYGSAFFGALARGLLGRSATSTITVSLFVFNIVIFLSYLIAFAIPLADATNFDPAIWAAVLFVANIVFLRRDLNATVASALIVGAANVVLIVVISSLALTESNAVNLGFARIPFFGSNPAEVGAIGLAFGVVIMAFFGHTSVGLVAKLILEREPTGRALMRGTIAATLTVIVLYSFAVFAMQGALSPAQLAGQEGTVLEPLARKVGPIISVLGAIYVLFAVGLVSIYTSLGMANQVREWLSGRITGAPASFLGLVPTIVVFVVVEMLLLWDRASFAEPLALIGTLAVPLLGGVFPMMLLSASRHRGDRLPSAWMRMLGGPISITLVALVFLAGLIVQGFFIWQEPWERIAAGIVVAGTVALTWTTVRRGSYRPQVVIEIRREPTGRGAFAFLAGGEPLEVQVQIEHHASGLDQSASEGDIEDFDDLRSVRAELPSVEARQLRAWVHSVDAEGVSHPISSTVELVTDGTTHATMEISGESEVIPLDGRPIEVRILL